MALGLFPTAGAVLTGAGLSFQLSPNTDNTFQTGYGKMGFVPSGVSTGFYLAQTGNFNSTDFALQQNAAGQTVLNGKIGALIISIGGATKVQVGSSLVTFPSGVPVTISDTTASTTSGTGCLVLAGGLGVAGAVRTGGVIVSGSDVAATGSGRMQFFNGQSAFPAIAGAALIYRSGGTITPNAGDMVFQSDNAGFRDFYFAAGATTANAASINGTNGTFSALIAGGGISIKSGSNARCGTATLVAGTVTVANTSVTANTKVFPVHATIGGTVGTLTYTKINATSFTINSTNAADTSAVDWLLVENP